MSSPNPPPRQRSRARATQRCTFDRPSWRCLRSVCTTWVRSRPPPPSPQRTPPSTTLVTVVLGRAVERDGVVPGPRSRQTCASATADAHAPHRASRGGVPLWGRQRVGAAGGGPLHGPPLHEATVGVRGRAGCPVPFPEQEKGREGTLNAQMWVQGARAWGSARGPSVALGPPRRRVPITSNGGAGSAGRPPSPLGHQPGGVCVVPATQTSPLCPFSGSSLLLFLPNRPPPRAAVEATDRGGAVAR